MTASSLQTPHLLRLCGVLASSLILTCSLAASGQQTPPPSDPKPPAPAPATPPIAAQPPKDLPPAEAIVDRAIEAMGGQEAFDKITSTHMKGTLKMPGMSEGTLELYSLKPDKFLIRQGTPEIGDTLLGSDGKVAWMKNMMGYELLDEKEARETSRSSNMFGMILTLKGDHNEIKTVDKAQFGGADVYKVQVTEKEKKADEPAGEHFALFGVDDGMIKGMEIKQSGVTINISFKEWKKVENLMAFTRMEIDQPGMSILVNFTEIEFNKVDPSVFELPAEVKELVKKRDAKPTLEPMKPAPAEPAAPTTPPKPGGGA